MGRERWMKSNIQLIEAQLLGLADRCGFYMVLLGQVLQSLRSLKRRSRDVLDQMNLCGVLSFPVVMLIGAFSGMILAVQAGIVFKAYGQEREIGRLVAIAMTREMGPVFTAIILTGRVGSAMAAELGTMSVSEEIDALRVMSIDPAEFLVMPRFLALVIMCPLLTIYADLIGVIGGAVVGNLQLDVGYSAYFESCKKQLLNKDIYGGLLKSLVFGGIISIVGCAQGLKAQNGAEGVGRATRNSVVISFVMITMFDYFINSFLRYLYD